MSNFQLGLLISGALVLVAVLGYNAWITHRNAPKRALPPEPGAAPEPLARLEPDFDGAALGLPASADDTEPAFDGHAVDLRDALQLPVPPAERRGGLDPLIDAIVPIAAEQQVSGDAALAALPPTRRAGSKPFAIEGFNEATQQWETPQPGQRYRQFQAGVQLANRLGALNEIEFSEFVMKAQGFADAINAMPDFPDMLHEVARARELDQFASEHDAQLSFLLRARQAAWSPGYVQQNAARLGLVAGAIPGRLVLPAGEAGLPPVLTLSYDSQAAMSDDPEQSAVRDIMLSLDVPLVHRAQQPFARLREIAAALGQVMDGVLCDQNGTPLPAMAMDPIAADLEQLYDKLDSRDLPAGSVLARRLFS
ncbi:cell division protein FtsZ [Diaphorobacter sp.]|uniref:cell division protein FtsZ n=1 Tax=Diaphorobacter sp. TaxID=1934310 RepID=UPI003D12D508